MVSKMKDRTSMFRDKTAIIVCHDAMFGPPHELRDYLLKHNIKRLLFIGHQNRALADNPLKSSYIEIYEDGALRYKHSAVEIHLPEIIAYVRDFIVTFYWSLCFSKGTIQYFIGVGNLDALNGIILRFFGIVEKTIYYVIDYIPDRFANSIINTIYHDIEFICAKYSISTWNYSERMIRARNKKWKTRLARQLVVPNGVRLHEDVIAAAGVFNHTQLVYIGVLSEQQGILMVIDSITELKRLLPSITLRIIGMGPLAKTIKKRIHDLKLEKHIIIEGFVADPQKADALVSKAALGIAMYDPNMGFVQYTEPGKVKRYLACSVPVIMTNVSPVANMIVRGHCGFTCRYDIHEFARTVVSFLRNANKVKQYRNHSIQFARRYEWDVIYSNAFHMIRT
jgi:glycosyltransferase involved in cell wall biosynthesis